MKRTFVYGFGVALMLACVAAPAVAKSNLRETPLVKAIKRCKASVVNIHSEKTTYNNDSLFSNSRGRKVNGMGTGIVVDERGYIVTNHHVVHGVDSLRVTLVDGSTYRASVVSYDSRHDLAVIKINTSKKLPVMPLGTSSDLMLGEDVFAVGNAFGYEHTVTKGIVSALHRDVEVNEKQSYENLIQTDASINPGNSGGPLLNVNGEVIGVNVAIRAGAQRIGFAIPIDDARKIVASLLNVEQLDNTYHGLIGVHRRVGEYSQYVVSGAEKGSPAEQAGIRPGDVITQVDAVAVQDAVDLERAMLGHSPGESIPVVLRRHNERLTVDVQLARSNGRVRNNHQVIAHRAPAATKAWSMLGLRLGPIEKSEVRQLGPKYSGGLRVLAVRNGSPAATSGIREGDILVGLHIWETVNDENIAYVVNHPQFSTFNPLKFYVFRSGETLWGQMEVALRQ